MKRRKSDLIVIASAKAKPGEGSELNRALLEAAGPTRRQLGCVSFSLYHSVHDPTTIIGFERWATERDHEQHLRGAHVQILMSKMSELLAEPPVILSYGITDEL
jgi:quinol monooxygenase YgiN